MKETLAERVLIGVLAAIVAALGALLWLVVDYFWWEFLPIEASTMGGFLQKTWFVSPLVGIVAMAIAMWRGSQAMDFALEVWRDIW
jgi:uncharacterized membrane protein